MGGFHGGFFICDELEEVCGIKMVENEKIRHFLGKLRNGTGTKKWYLYPWCRGLVVPIPLKVVPVPIGSEGLVPVPVKWYWYHCFRQP